MQPAKTHWKVPHRKNQFKQLEGLSMEMIVRKSLAQVLREYVDNCSILGVKAMFHTRLHWKQRILHTCMFGLLVTLFGYFVHKWIYSSISPLIVNSESSTYPISEIDFPAIALCNVNRISKKAVKQFLKENTYLLENSNNSIEKVESYITQFGRLLDFSYEERFSNTVKRPFLESIMQDFDTRRIINIMKTLAPSCSEMLIRCSWNRKIVDCGSIFTVRRTALGHCCTFNYVLDYDSAKTPTNTLGEPKRQRLPGRMYGLNLIVNPMLDDYAYPIGPSLGFDLLLFDPTHFPDLSAGRIIRSLIQPNRAEYVELKSIKQIATPEVRKYTRSTRKCLFKDELKADFNNMYSYSACIISCRIKTIQSLCRCTPYFLPAGEDEGRICLMEDLKCLNKFKEKLQYLYPIGTETTEGLDIELEDSLFCPNCLPDCELTQHFAKIYKTQIVLLKEKPYWMHAFIKDLNITDKSLLSIHHAVSDGVLNRLDVVAYWFEVLSNVGGIGGIVLGLSVFSAVEIVYFLFVRFVVLLRYNYLNYY